MTGSGMLNYSSIIYLPCLSCKILFSVFWGLGSIKYTYIYNSYALLMDWSLYPHKMSFLSSSVFLSEGCFIPSLQKPLQLVSPCSSRLPVPHSFTSSFVCISYSKYALQGNSNSIVFLFIMPISALKKMLCLCLCVLDFACMYVCAPHVCLCPQRSEEGITCPGTEVIDECELPYGWWDPKSNKCAWLLNQLSILVSDIWLENLDQVSLM